MFDDKTLAEHDAKEMADRAGDAAILELFRDWMRLNRAYPGDSDDDEECDAALDAILAVERRLFDIPALGLVGLSVKICLLAEASHGLAPASQPGDPPRVGVFFGDDYMPDGRISPDTLKLRRLLEDAARLVPELAPFAEGITRAPVIHPQAQRE